MSFKRIVVKIVMMLLLWAALFGMFSITQNVHPWVRVALGIAICGAYVLAQVEINRKMYGIPKDESKGLFKDKDNR